MKRNGGFTLVELAIVLVIIGIILGAILKGQSLIQNARAKRVLNDMKGLEAMVWTFYDRYGFFPGDCNHDGTIGTHVAPNWTLGYLSTSTAAPSGFCDTSAGRDDVPFNDLRYAGIANREASNRDQFKHAFNGPFFIGYERINGAYYNVIAVNDIPCWAAKMIDQSIDGALDSSTGRIRRYTATDTVDTSDQWGTACTTEDTLVDILYFFDKQP